MHQREPTLGNTSSSPLLHAGQEMQPRQNRRCSNEPARLHKQLRPAARLVLVRGLHYLLHPAQREEDQGEQG